MFGRFRRAPKKAIVDPNQTLDRWLGQPDVSSFRGEDRASVTPPFLRMWVLLSIFTAIYFQRGVEIMLGTAAGVEHDDLLLNFGVPSINTTLSSYLPDARKLVSRSVSVW